MSQLVDQGDEIDLSELFAAILHNWWVVALVALSSAFMAGYYAFTMTTPIFEATTRFELLDSNQNTAGAGQAAGLAALAGISLPGAASEADALQDRVLSRPFIDSIYEKAGFGDDQVFNGTLRTPSLLDNIRDAVFGPVESREITRDDYLVMAIGALSQRMMISQSDNGIISLTVSHPDRVRAAYLANTIVDQSLLDIFERERNETRESLNYFAEELLQVRSDLDSAHAAVRDYAITNSLQSAEELARTSSQLAQVRRDIELIDQSMVALQKMSEVGFNGPDFAQNYPVSTRLSFRRLLNLSSDPNDWSQLSQVQFDNAMQRLRARRSPLQSSFNALEERARSSGAEALELEALTREVEVQQAIYESVITQFEARSLFSGYERASGRIVESAIAPNLASAPKKRLIVAVGLMFGVFFGAVLALLISIRRDVLFTRSAIRAAFSFNDVRRRTRSQLGNIDTLELSVKQLGSAQDLLVSVNASKCVSFISTGREDLSVRATLSFAKASTRLGEKTTILDLSGDGFEMLAQNSSPRIENDFFKHTLISGVEMLRPRNPDSFLKSSVGEKLLKSISQVNDRVLIILPALEYGTAMTRATMHLNQAAFVFAERAKTGRKSAEAIKSILSASKILDPILIVI